MGSPPLCVKCILFPSVRHEGSLDSSPRFFHSELSLAKLFSLLLNALPLLTLLLAFKADEFELFPFELFSFNPKTLSLTFQSVSFFPLLAFKLSLAQGVLIVASLLFTNIKALSHAHTLFPHPPQCHVIAAAQSVCTKRRGPPESRPHAHAPIVKGPLVEAWPPVEAYVTLVGTTNGRVRVAGREPLSRATASRVPVTD